MFISLKNFWMKNKFCWMRMWISELIEMYACQPIYDESILTFWVDFTEAAWVYLGCMKGESSTTHWKDMGHHVICRYVMCTDISGTYDVVFMNFSSGLLRFQQSATVLVDNLA